MRGIGLLKSLVGIVKKPKPVDPVDQAFDNIVKGKLDDVTQKVTNFYQHPPPCQQCGAKFDGWEQRDGHFFFGGCARPTGEFDSAAVAKRVRAEVNKLSPEEKSTISTSRKRSWPSPRPTLSRYRCRPAPS